MRSALRALGSLGIRTRLFVLVLCVALPFSVYVVYDAITGARLVSAQVTQQEIAVARVIAARFDDNVNNIDQLLGTLSYMVSGTAGAEPMNDRVLQDIRPNVPAYVRTILVFDLSGRSVGSSERATRGIDVHDRRWFQQALLVRGLVVEAPLAARPDGEPIAVIARPVEHGGVVTGVVSASIALRHLDRVLDAQGVLPHDAVALVTTAEGRVLNGAAVESQAPVMHLAEVSDSDGAYDHVDTDGLRRRYGYARARATPWVIHVGMDEREATAPVWRHLIGTLLLGGAVMLVALLLATTMARQIVRPLARLTDDARRLGRGELAHRSRIGGAGEIGILGDTLNRMAEEVERRTVDLTRSERELRLIADNLPVLMAIVGRDLRFRFCNESYRDWFGVDPRALAGRAFASVLGEAGFAAERGYVERALAGETVRFERTGTFGCEERHVYGAFVPMRDEASGRVDGFYVLVQDLTDRRRLEARLEKMAQFDQLTGLPNRYLLHDRLAQACHRSQRDATQLAVLYLDLDGFKPVNHGHGHAAGDYLLRVIGERLTRAVRRSDTVARIGGDEFVVLIDGFVSYAQLSRLAATIIERVSEPVPWEAGEIGCSVSVGVATYPPAPTWEAMLATADRAMYEAKARGRGTFVIAPMRDAAAAAIARAAAVR